MLFLYLQNLDSEKFAHVQCQFGDRHLNRFQLFLNCSSPLFLLLKLDGCLLLLPFMPAYKDHMALASQLFFAFSTCCDSDIMLIGPNTIQ